MAEYKLTNREWTELVRKAQNGEEAGFEELYRASYNYLYAVCFKSGVPDEDIPDVLQESYIKIFKKIDTLEEPGTFLGWASTIVKNTGRDKGRQRKTYYERNDLMGDSSTEDEIGMDTMAVDEMDPDYNPGVALDKVATVEIVRSMIAELPDTQRDCIILWCEGRSMSEISKEVGIPVGSVKSSISYAKKKIKDMTLKIEKEQGIRLHTVAPMSFFIWAIRNIQDLLEFAPCDFSNILPVLKEAEIIAAKDASVLSDGTEANTAAKKAADKVGKDMGPEKGGTSSTETGQVAAEQAGEIGGEKAAKRAGTEIGEKVIKNVTGASETKAAGVLSTMGGKAAVAGLVVVIGASSLYFASGAGNQKPEEAAAAVTQETAEDVTAEESAQGEEAEMSQNTEATAEKVQEQEAASLLEQIPDMAAAVEDMQPAIFAYTDTRSPQETLDKSVVMSAEDNDVFWTFVNCYTLRYGELENHYFISYQEDWEPLCAVAFPDFKGVPDTLDQYISDNYAEYLHITFEDGVYSRMAYGAEGLFTGLEVAEWTSNGDDSVDVTVNRTFPYTGDVVETVVVHLVPNENAIKSGDKLKFMISDADMTYSMPRDERDALLSY